MLIFPPVPYGWPWSFPVETEPIAGGLEAPFGGTVTAVDVSAPSASLSWAGVAGADHYDLYRSLSPLTLGSKVNLVPIHDGGGPGYAVSWTDADAPPVGKSLYYRLVAMDANGNWGAVPDAVPACIESSQYVRDPVLATLVGALQADPTLMAMLGNDPGQVRFAKRISEVGDTYPFVVLWRSDWKEDIRFKDDRHGTLEYMVSVVSNVPSSPVVVDVLNRVCSLLDGDAGKDAFNGSDSVMVMSSMFMGGGPESFLDSEKVWFQDGRVRLTVELFAT